MSLLLDICYCISGTACSLSCRQQVEIWLLSRPVAGKRVYLGGIRLARRRPIRELFSGPAKKMMST